MSKQLHGRSQLPGNPVVCLTHATTLIGELYLILQILAEAFSLDPQANTWGRDTTWRSRLPVVDPMQPYQLSWTDLSGGHVVPFWDQSDHLIQLELSDPRAIVPFTVTRLGATEYRGFFFPARRLLAAGIWLDAATGVLHVRGTEGADIILLSFRPNVTIATIHAFGRTNASVPLLRASFPAADVDAIEVHGLGGDDVVRNGTALPAEMWGGDGDDRLNGGRAGDVLHGEAGDDHLFGGDGMDVLLGGAGLDRLYGQGGADYLDGGQDGLSDFLDGGRDGSEDLFVDYVSRFFVYEVPVYHPEDMTWHIEERIGIEIVPMEFTAVNGRFRDEPPPPVFPDFGEAP